MSGRDQAPGFRRSKIEAHHRSVVGAFGDLVHGPVKFNYDENWWRRADRQMVVFDLIGDSLQRAKRKTGSWMPVVALVSRKDWWGDCHAWVSWHEEWISQSGQSFAIRSTGLTVYWGPQDDKRQLIRAEWAEPPLHGGEAAQPHWHADFDELVAIPPQIGMPSGNDTDLQAQIEIDEAAELGISLSKFHLAMGGWTCSEVNGNPWQARIGVDLPRLSKWAKATIEYISMQISGCRQVPWSTRL